MSDQTTEPAVVPATQVDSPMAAPTEPDTDAAAAAATHVEGAGTTESAEPDFTGQPPTPASPDNPPLTTPREEAAPQATIQRTVPKDQVRSQPGGAVTGEIVDDDVDLDLDEANVITVKLGGHKWHAIEPSIAVNRKLAYTLPTVDQDGDQREAAENALKNLYPQVAECMRDPESGDPPSREFVEKYLTARNFGRLMEKLNESGNPRRR